MDLPDEQLQCVACTRKCMDNSWKEMRGFPSGSVTERWNISPVIEDLLSEIEFQLYKWLQSDRAAEAAWNRVKPGPFS